MSGNDAGVEQISFETGAISTEMGTGGIRVNLIPKEGGNTFKGTFFLNGTNSSLQGDNLTADLQSQGLKAVNKMKRVWDVNGSIGGPVVKNNLWFYFASGSRSPMSRRRPCRFETMRRAGASMPLRTTRNTSPRCEPTRRRCRT